MDSRARPLPSYMVERWRGWRATRFDENRAWFARLAEDGQRPRAMVISCCDSRVDAAQLFGAEPGEIFIVRNVANVVPPADLDGGRHGTSAAIEFAVNKLRVLHLIVLGHSDCGGVSACHAMCSGAHHRGEPSSFIDKWLAVLRPAYDNLPKERRDDLSALERQGVLESLRNLESYPFVAEAVNQGRLTLHGAWIDIAEGRLHAYDPASREFLPADGKPD